jgi:hypothetical protein
MSPPWSSGRAKGHSRASQQPRKSNERPFLRRGNRLNGLAQQSNGSGGARERIRRVQPKYAAVGLAPFPVDLERKKPAVARWQKYGLRGSRHQSIHWQCSLYRRGAGRLHGDH